jgi:hypothetical protein
VTHGNDTRQFLSGSDGQHAWRRWCWANRWTHPVPDACRIASLGAPLRWDGPGHDGDGASDVVPDDAVDAVGEDAAHAEDGDAQGAAGGPYDGDGLHADDQQLRALQQQLHESAVAYCAYADWLNADTARNTYKRLRTAGNDGPSNPRRDTRIRPSQSGAGTASGPVHATAAEAPPRTGQ